MPNARRGIKSIFGRSTALLLSITLAVSTGTQKARAAGDIGQVASMAGMLGMVVMGLAGHDVVSSTKDCICNMAESSCPEGPWGSCTFMALNVAALAAAIVPILTSGDTGGAVAGGGSVTPAKKFDPNIPLAKQLGCPPTQVGCDCSSADADMNPLCGPNGLNNVKNALLNRQNGLRNGSILPPDGTSSEDAIAAGDKALSDLDGLLGGDLSGIETASLGDLAGGGKSGGSGKGDLIAGGVDFGPANTIKAGPQDRSGLGKISLINGLDAVDEATGKSLTLWQRNTRRQQGDEKGTRAFLMAKVEFIRKQASKKTELAKATPPKTPSKEPDRAPASTEVRHDHKIEGRH